MWPGMSRALWCLWQDSCGDKGTELGCLMYISAFLFQSHLHQAELITPNCNDWQNNSNDIPEAASAFIFPGPVQDSFLSDLPADEIVGRDCPSHLPSNDRYRWKPDIPFPALRQGLLLSFQWNWASLGKIRHGNSQTWQVKTIPLERALDGSPPCIEQWVLSAMGWSATVQWEPY